MQRSSKDIKEAVGVCRMVVFAIAGMQQGKSRAQHIPVRKPFAGVQNCVGGCGRSSYQLYTNKTLSASLQQDEAKAESESNEGDDSPTCNDRSLGSNDADIDLHPPTLPPTNTIGT